MTVAGVCCTNGAALMMSWAECANFANFFFFKNGAPCGMILSPAFASLADTP